MLGEPSWQQIINQSQLNENAEIAQDLSGQAKKRAKDTVSLEAQMLGSSCGVGFVLRGTHWPHSLC